MAFWALPVAEVVVLVERLVVMVGAVAAVIVTPIDLLAFVPVAVVEVQLAVAAPIRVASAVVGDVSALGPNLVEAARVGLNL